jgi:hypothetical protein
LAIAPELWSLIMMARANHALLNDRPHTPWPDVRDSDEVLLALEKARGFEAEGDLPHAMQWLQRAAQASKKQGNVERAQSMADAAADLANMLQSAADAAAPGSVPTLNVRGSRSAQVPRRERLAAKSESRPPSSSRPQATSGSVPPMIAALVSSIPPFSSRVSPTPPPPNGADATPESKPVNERRVRIASLRVALKESLANAKTITVERLTKGEPVPAGALEAVLVITGEIDGSLLIETHVPVVGGTGTKS